MRDNVKQTLLEAVAAALDGCPYITKGYTLWVAQAVLESLELTPERSDRTKRAGDPLIYERHVTPWEMV